MITKQLTHRQKTSGSKCLNSITMATDVQHAHSYIYHEGSKFLKSSDQPTRQETRPKFLIIQIMYFMLSNAFYGGMHLKSVQQKLSVLVFRLYGRTYWTYISKMETVCSSKKLSTYLHTGSQPTTTLTSTPPWRPHISHGLDVSQDMALLNTVMSVRVP
jgi:hypothetical protein